MIGIAFDGDGHLSFLAGKGAIFRRVRSKLVENQGEWRGGAFTDGNAGADDAETCVSSGIVRCQQIGQQPG